MDFEEALKVVKAVIYAKEGKSLSEAELLVLQGSWDGQTYEDMAKNSPYEVNYLKADVGPKLWKLLSKALEEEVSKKNFRAALEKSQSKDIPHSQAPIASGFVGTIVGERFKIIELLDRGEYGETYLAEDERLRLPNNPRRVIKRLRSDPRETKGKFDRQAAVLSQLGEHPQIPTLFDKFEEDGYFYLVQQFIEGHYLSEELKECQPWSEDQVITLLRDILEILKFVHRYSVIHRNINPHNLIRREIDDKLVLTNFGSVKRIHTRQERTFTGSSAYIPPEQAMGFPQLCSDIYAVGIIGIQALTGLEPKKLEVNDENDIIWRNKAQVSPELAKVLDKMVCSNYHKRYQSAKEALQAVRALVPPG